MAYMLSGNKRRTLPERALCIMLALMLVFGAVFAAPVSIKAEAASNLQFGENYVIKIDIKVTDDADGWNSAYCKIYAKDNNGTGTEREIEQYDIKSSIDHSDGTWTVTRDLGTAFPSDVLVYTDFGGGFTWREWKAEVNIYVNGVNVRSSYITSSSSCFSSSNDYNYLPIDPIHYPYPKTINIINHHSVIPNLPQEENFNEFYEGQQAGTASGRIFINACDIYGVTWRGYKGSAGEPSKETNDSGDSWKVYKNISADGVSPGVEYLLSSTSGTDHKSTYTFTFSTGNESHSKVTKDVTVYYYFKHSLRVKVKNSVVYTANKFRGEWVDLSEVPVPAGYTLTGYDQEGDGVYDYDANQFTFGAGNTVLTAALKANKYKIAFNGNGSTAGSMNSTKTATYDTPLQLPANSFSRRDELGTYKFLGWNTEPDGSGTFISNKGFAINLTSVSNEVVTLYAQWSLIGWNVTLHYPEEMGMEDRTVSVSKTEGFNYFEPETIIDTGDEQYHYIYTGSNADLSDINEDMDVTLSYERVSHISSDVNVVEPPACEESGQSETHCVDCGYEISTIVVPPTGHSFGEPEWNWSADESEADAVFTCGKCGKVETVHCESTFVDDENTRTISVSAEKDGATYTDSITHHINYISYDLNGGTGSLNTNIVYDGDFELPDLHPSAYMPYANFTGWLIGDRVYQPGDIIEAGDYTVIAQWEIPWANIQSAINGGAGSINLSGDIVATAQDGPLTVPAGRTVTINLNGYNIDRNLDEPTQDGSVFRITGGTLTLTDSKGTGKVTGGNTTGNGGGIYVESGRVFVYSGSVSRNIAAGNGGGIYIAGTSGSNKVKISGGAVCENICGGSGSGVYASGENNSFELDGSAEVTGNVCTGANQSAGGVYAESVDFKINNNPKVYNNYKADESRSNVVLGGDSQQITVWYPLGSNALIYISGEPGRVLVHDTNVDDSPSFTPDVSNYASDSYAYAPALDGNKDIVFENHSHTFGQPVWVWSDDCSSAQAVFGCTGCDYSETCNAAVTQTDSSTHFIYTAVVTFGGEEYSDTAQKAKGWNLFVSGTQVNGDNYNDVLGDGKVQYDVSTNTLTLSGAVIEAAARPGDSANEFGIRYSVNRGTPFKIALNGENTIVNNSTGEETLRVFGIACYNGSNGSYDSKPVFSGGGTLNIDFDTTGLEGSAGICCTASVLTFDNCALNITMTGGAGDEALQCNNSVVFRNGASASLTTGGDAVSLNAKSLDVSEDSSLTLVSNSSAASAGCVLTDGTKALGARVNTEPVSENGTAWDGETALDGYKFISIPSAFTVIWVVNGETVETDENVPGGAIPEYNGETPADYDDGGFSYCFAGWSPEISPVAADSTYTAVYTREEWFVSSFTADKTEVLRGETVTFTVVTSDNIRFIRLTDAIDGVTVNSTGFSKMSAGSGYTDNGDGTATWVLPVTATYNDYGKTSEVNTYKVYYYKDSQKVLVESKAQPVSVTVSKYDASAEIHEVAGEEVDPYSIISVQADQGKKLSYTNITITTTSDVTKLRLTVDGKAAVYSASSKNVTYTDNGDGTATWVIGYRFTKAGEFNILAESRGNSWEGCSSATVTATIYNSAAELAAAQG